jgi:oxygen-independent coproporphyrinogen III oxidase
MLSVNITKSLYANNNDSGQALFLRPIMAGIYIHVPFCRKACHYCNFHFSTLLSNQSAMVDAICMELSLRKNFFGAPAPLSSVYLGGGTPSLLSVEELQKIFSTISVHFEILPGAEITLEANPDDLSTSYLQALQLQTPVNRLSIGVQSFREDTLQWMNRAHNAEQSLQAITLAREAGFENISIDLIYGLPAPFDQAWEEDLQTAIDLGIPHLSCYALTIEPKTALAYQIRKKAETPPSDQVNEIQFHLLTSKAREAGYRHYEISNMALPGYEAQHNSSYWKRDPYLGIGPAAHSYRPHMRSWNISNNARYIAALQRGEIPSEVETLSLADQYNEYIMTGLRLEEGIRTDLLAALYGEDIAAYFFNQLVQLNPVHYAQTGNVIALTDTGRLWCDNISGTLFFTS